MGCFKPADVMSFAAGLEQDLHKKCKRSVKTFCHALHEAMVYLQVRTCRDPLIDTLTRMFIC
jgi:hypothetical protein